MKNKDQKELEALYESLIKPNFVFLDEEIMFIKEMSQKLAEKLIETIKTTAEFKQQVSLYGLFVSKNPVEFQKVTNEAVEKINFESQDIKQSFIELYEKYVVKDMMKAVTIIPQQPIDYLYFLNPFDFKHELYPIDLKQKQLEILFEKYLKLFNQFAFTDSYTIRCLEMEYQTIKKGYLWREERVKFQDLRKKLPELEGLI